MNSAYNYTQELSEVNYVMWVSSMIIELRTKSSLQLGIEPLVIVHFRLPPYTYYKILIYVNSMEMQTHNFEFHVCTYIVRGMCVGTFFIAFTFFRCNVCIVLLIFTHLCPFMYYFYFVLLFLLNFSWKPTKYNDNTQLLQQQQHKKTSWQIPQMTVQVWLSSPVFFPSFSLLYYF